MTDQTPATAAGRKLLAYLDNEWSDKWDIDADAILAIEAEAVVAERAKIAEAVRGLPSGVGRVGSRSVSVVDRSAVLAIVEKP